MLVTVAAVVAENPPKTLSKSVKVGDVVRCPSLQHTCTCCKLHGLQAFRRRGEARARARFWLFKCVPVGRGSVAPVLFRARGPSSWGRGSSGFACRRCRSDWCTTACCGCTLSLAGRRSAADAARWTEEVQRVLSRPGGGGEIFKRSRVGSADIVAGRRVLLTQSIAQLSPHCTAITFPSGGVL